MYSSKFRSVKVMFCRFSCRCLGIILMLAFNKVWYFVYHCRLQLAYISVCYILDIAKVHERRLTATISWTTGSSATRSNKILTENSIINDMKSFQVKTSYLGDIL